ncbi:MAG TPA: GNAT family N-acetyltransferase [Treponemataceae bacterium]|nr:GNAT family N-acetyltransferase [Treponemataceae bacterium]HPS45269.1 GNAT family N-acetyltransferase [Treponemataceae bacterium]
METRFAETEDLPQILELYQELNPDDEPLSASAAAEIWAKSLQGDRVRYVVAVEGGRVIATCNIAIIPNLTRAGRPYGIIENVITSGNYRRKGIGRAVIEYAVRHARQTGCYKVALLSGVKRREAHRFYESLGFDGTSKKGFEIRFEAH